MCGEINLPQAYVELQQQAQQWQPHKQQNPVVQQWQSVNHLPQHNQLDWMHKNVGYLSVSTRIGKFAPHSLIINKRGRIKEGSHKGIFYRTTQDPAKHAIVNIPEPDSR